MCVCVCVCVCSKSTRICGISVTVPDFYPILKYLEHTQKRHTSSYTASSQPATQQSRSSSQHTLLPVVAEVLEESTERSHDPQTESHDNGVTVEPSSCTNRVVDINMLDEEVKKLARKCKDRCRLLSCDIPGSPRSTSSWVGPSEDGPVQTADGLTTGIDTLDPRRRRPSNDSR